ncbi:hypothetical protein Pla144_11400 [Bythopirellula polymerisocia]|uniref:Uncharacterized protein n=1 Tax=Bythopirellula polymerisocia TaxID=2528003 RepID=A0A5C6D3B7_9BACT|nr:hypothetical protein Pla144_11400 [Bythopirellula polymerisocia]
MQNRCAILVSNCSVKELLHNNFDLFRYILELFEQEERETTEANSSVSSVYSSHSLQVSSWEDQPRQTIG